MHQTRDPQGLGEIDLLAGGVPCPPFSIAGKQLGHLDELVSRSFAHRQHLPAQSDHARKCKRNTRQEVRRISPKYPTRVGSVWISMPLELDQCIRSWGVSTPAARHPRRVKKGLFPLFHLARKVQYPPMTVGQLLYEEMRSLGWAGASEWSQKANNIIAPTLAGGSKKHGGADLGPTRAKRAWSTLGVDGAGLADAPPSPDLDRMPRLIKMAALVQGFPNDWKFAGTQTEAYRQVGNAFPPPVALVMGKSILEAFSRHEAEKPKVERLHKAKLREFFLENVGVVLDSKTLQEASGNASEWARRIRELRGEEGMNIVTNNDRSDLKPGEYLLIDAKPLPAFSRSISKETRAFVLDRNGFTCQMCGAAAGEPHPYDNGRKTRLHIGHTIDKSMGGTDDPSNLRAICSVCNEGASNLTLNRPDAIKLIAQVRRAPIKDQMDVLRWIVTKFPKQAAEMIQAQNK